jgi:type IV secretion system protein VirB5
MKIGRVLVLMVASMCAFSGARAAMPVTDAGAIMQMVQQLIVMREQLTEARNQLTQAQRQYESMTGRRGMERLLAGTSRNYLPPDWAALEAALRGAESAYAALASQMDAAMRGNAVLTPAQTARLGPDQLSQLEANRRAVALAQVTSREALQASSARFASLQGLIDAIGSAEDPKAVADLQARIAAEQAMLQNEHTKLMVLHQAALAEDRAQQQRARELAIANFGSLRELPAVGLRR